MAAGRDAASSAGTQLDEIATNRFVAELLMSRTSLPSMDWRVASVSVPSR